MVEQERGCLLHGLMSSPYLTHNTSQPKFCNSNQDSCTDANSADARDVLFAAIKGLVFLRLARHKQGPLQTIKIDHKKAKVSLFMKPTTNWNKSALFL
jgi:hypothetical protein